MRPLSSCLSFYWLAIPTLIAVDHGSLGPVNLPHTTTYPNNYGNNNDDGDNCANDSNNRSEEERNAL